MFYIIDFGLGEFMKQKLFLNVLLITLLFVGCSPTQKKYDFVVDQSAGKVLGRVDETLYFDATVVSEDMCGLGNVVTVQPYDLSECLDGLLDFVNPNKVEYEAVDSDAVIFENGSKLYYRSDLFLFSSERYNFIHPLIELNPIEGTLRFDYSHLLDNGLIEHENFTLNQLENEINDLFDRVDIDIAQDMDVYVITHDQLKRIEERLIGTATDDTSFTPKVTWDENDDVYFIRARQEINRIKVFEDEIGFGALSGASVPPTIEICFSRNGCEFLNINLPMEVANQYESDGIISLDAAIAVFIEHSKDIIRTSDCVVNEVSLSYAPISVPINNGQRLSPCWIFTVQQVVGDGDFYESVVVIDAITGKQVF